MSLSELKQAVDDLSEKDRAELSSYLIQLARLNDPEWQAEIQESVEELQSGQGVSREQLDAILRDTPKS